MFFLGKKFSLLVNLSVAVKINQNYRDSNSCFPLIEILNYSWYENWGRNSKLEAKVDGEVQEI